MGLCGNLSRPPFLFATEFWTNFVSQYFKKDHPGPPTSLQDFARGEYHNPLTRLPGHEKGMFARALPGKFSKPQRLTCLCTVYFNSWTVQARNLLAHFWAAETGEIHPQLTRPRFKTSRTPLHANCGDLK